MRVDFLIAFGAGAGFGFNFFEVAFGAISAFFVRFGPGDADRDDRSESPSSAVLRSFGRLLVEPVGARGGIGAESGMAV